MRAFACRARMFMSLEGSCQAGVFWRPAIIMPRLVRCCVVGDVGHCAYWRSASVPACCGAVRLLYPLLQAMLTLRNPETFGAMADSWVWHPIVMVRAH